MVSYDRNREEAGMEKKQWILGIAAVFCSLLMVVAHPSPAQAAAVRQSDQNAYGSVFDASYYYSTYPDIAAAFGMNEKALFSHFVQYGVKEGRSASETFNVLAYMQRYEDLRNAFGNDLAAYCRHYQQYGRSEGRNGRLDGMDLTEARRSLEKAAGTLEGGQKAAGGDLQAGAAVSGNVIGTYTTEYKENVPRAANVRLAAQRINGVVVQPGDSFSFSRTILARTAANGYVTAPIFVSGTVGSGTGGGVCQVSSTLYASMVSAGLSATERHAHSLQVDYLPAGLDATIAGDYLDLKFINVYAQPLMIQANADNGILTVTLILQ